MLAASIADERGTIWRLLTLSGAKGTHTVTWDLHGSPDTPADAPGAQAGASCNACELVPPGKYNVLIGKRERGGFTPLSATAAFTLRPDPELPISATDLQVALDYRQKQSKLSRQVTQAVDAATAAKAKIDAIVKVLSQMTTAPKVLHEQARNIGDRLVAFLRAVRGDEVNSARGEQVPVAIQSHVRAASPSGPIGPTKTNLEQFAIAAAAFPPEYDKLKPILLTDIPALEKELERIGAPITPGRIPDIRP